MYHKSSHFQGAVIVINIYIFYITIFFITFCILYFYCSGDIFYWKKQNNNHGIMLWFNNDNSPKNQHKLEFTQI